MTAQRIFKVFVCLTALQPVAAQPELDAPRPDLMGWRTSETVSAKKIRAKLATAGAELAAVRLTNEFARQPHNPQDLQAALPPEAENAASDYDHLTRLLAAKPLDTNGFIAVKNVARGETSPAYQTAARALLERRPDVMEIAERAAAKPLCVFKRDYNQGFEMNMSELTAQRTAATMLCARQALQNSDGRPLEAIALAQGIYRIAQHAAAEPLLLPFLVGLAIEQMETNQLSAILRAHAKDAAHCAAVREAVEKWRKPLEFQNVVRGEWIMASGELNKLRTAPPARWQAWIENFVPNSTLFANSKIPEKFSADEAKFLGALLDAVELRLLHSMTILLPADSEIRLDPIDHFSAVLPDFARIREKVFTAKTQTASLLAGCNVLIHKAKTGDWPKTLAETGTVSDEKLSLRYTPTPEGFTIKSTLVATVGFAFP